MSGMTAEPHLTVQFCESDGQPGADDGWVDYRRYHIASPDAGANNMYVGDQINCMRESVESNPELWWRIVYEEHKQISTTAGTVSLGKTVIQVTANNKHGVHVEEFQDRNGDGYYELNVGIPIYEQYPRFWTEHDIAAEPKDADPETIKVGDYVKVSDPAYCHEPGGDTEGYVDEDFFGRVCKVVSVKEANDNIRVEHPDTGDTNVIHPDHLTKVNRDGSPIEKKDEEFKAGEDVEGEDQPDDTIHVSDGDVITVYDEYGHEKTMRVSVI